MVSTNPPSTARAPFASQTASQPAVASSSMPPELEQTLSMLSSHRSVLGYLLITRGQHPSIIRHSGVVFEGEQGKRYAAVVARIVESVRSGLEEVRADDGIGAAGETDVDEVRFVRIRTKRHEIMISPGEGVEC
ncbi:hypothetical protein D9613_009383 [Agrocybe pediades]|uniref:Roadblock/LAMTOR2 domain-containing protein n=1 Tax=Agrocybe pediades TaxID=84607 RepID=A0A8H4R4X6_9AGAR|nr:hypothetical protein D9613_009383 [Agrocybe pediades]